MLEVSETKPFEYAPTPKTHPVGQRPRSPEIISPAHFEDAQETIAPGDIDMDGPVDLLASPGKRLKKEGTAWTPTKLDAPFGMNTAGTSPATATATAAAAPPVAPPMPDPTSALILKSLSEVVASLSRVETSGTRLELKLEHYVADLSDRLEGGSNLNRDETDDQIAGLRTHIQSLQAQQQKQQLDFSEKIAACATSSTTPFDREGLKKEIVQEVRGDSRAGVPVAARPSVPLAAAPVTPHESDKFVPRRLFIKGFCNYGCEADQGISEASATTAATSCLTQLRVEYRRFLAENNGGVMAPRFRNSQITALIRDGAPDDAVWLILKDLKTVLEITPCTSTRRPCSFKLMSRFGRNIDEQVWQKPPRPSPMSTRMEVQVWTSRRIGRREPFGQTA